MKKWMLVLTAVVALSGGTLMAVGISNLSGQSCGDFEGVWHFVNNKVTDTSGASLTACYDTGDCITVGPSAVNKSTVHFVVVSSGALLTADSNLDGRLVLSDFTCGGKEPPKCDPKTEVCK